MACAAIVRGSRLRNSYITVVSSPGCTCRLRVSGLNSQIPRALASNSTVIVRERSTCVLAACVALPGTWRSESDSTLMPSALQIERYTGTSA
jgi:hypothetical protein